MNRLTASDLASFQRKYRFAGGHLRRLRIRYPAEGAPTVEFTLSVRPALKDLGADAKPIRLRFQLTGAEEFRFQKRPGSTGGKITDARFGYFDGLFFVNLDAFGLQPGEVPMAHDFRASDAYAAARELWWEEGRKGDPGASATG
jgi:hypothetical protein